MKYFGEMKITEEELINLSKSEVLKAESMHLIPKELAEKQIYKIELKHDYNRIYITLYYDCLPNLRIYRFIYNKIDHKLFMEKLELSKNDLLIINEYGKKTKKEPKLRII